MMKFAFTAVAAVAANSAHAINVDGALDASGYTLRASIPYSVFPNGDFNTYGDHSSPAYKIYLGGSGGYVYGFLRADTSQGGSVVLAPFANVYFDIDPATGNGADLVFELSASAQRVSALYNAPMPIAAPGISVAVSADNQGIEFAIPVSYFTTAYAGVDYDPSQVFGTLGGSTTLRISQSFGYDVVGGPSFGPTRLGSAILTAGVPEPATWGLMIAGFAMTGLSTRRRKVAMA